jgi:hypothetical protein
MPQRRTRISTSPTAGAGSLLDRDLTGLVEDHLGADVRSGPCLANTIVMIDAADPGPRIHSGVVVLTRGRRVRR